MMMYKKWMAAAAVTALLTAASARAEDTAEKAGPSESGGIMVLIEEGVPGGVIIETREISAEVVAIDYEKRTATLKGPEGNTIAVAPGPEAINFNQVKTGDLVRVTSTSTLDIYIGDEVDEMLDGAEGLAILAAEGDRPGGIVAETVQMTATVTAIDLENRAATLRFRDGSEKVVKVRPDIALAEGQVGLKVVIQSTTAVAVDVIEQ